MTDTLAYSGNGQLTKENDYNFGHRGTKTVDLIGNCKTGLKMRKG